MCIKALRLFLPILMLSSLSLPSQAKNLNLRAEQSAPTHLMHKQERVQQRQVISPEEAVHRARREYPGKVLSVRLRGDSEYYAVKIMKQGKVRVVHVPAQR